MTLLRRALSEIARLAQEAVDETVREERWTLIRSQQPDPVEVIRWRLGIPDTSRAINTEKMFR